MLYELKNDNLSFTADTFGAELHSLKLNGLEYLWQCGDSWKRYAPVLFPFICSPKNNEYRADGKLFKMKANHGFARDLEFELLEQNSTGISFILHSNDITLAQYPYDFEFIVKYTLLADGVNVENIVRNTGDKPMYFYIGGHPAFNCPLSDGETFEDYYVEYEKNEHITRNINNSDVTLVENGNILPLTRELFDYDSIPVAQPNSKKISLRSEKSEHSVTVDFPQSECITIWSPTGDRNAAFLCLEPWTSVPTYFDDDEMDIEKKAHAIKLDSGKSYSYAYSIHLS